MTIERCVNTNLLVDIWLEASAHGHDFVPLRLWLKAAHRMRTEYLPHSENYLCRDESGDPLGFVSLTPGRIEALFVLPKFEGRGVGRSLLDFAKGLCPELTLSVFEKNGRALRFYRRNGFRVTGRGIDGYTGEPELTMTCISGSALPPAGACLSRNSSE